MVQGIVRGLAEYVKIVEEIHFTHIPSLFFYDLLQTLVEMAKNIGYDVKELESIPETPILGWDVVSQ